MITENNIGQAQQAYLKLKSDLDNYKTEKTRLETLIETAEKEKKETLAEILKLSGKQTIKEAEQALVDLGKKIDTLVSEAEALINDTIRSN